MKMSINRKKAIDVLTLLLLSAICVFGVKISNDVFSESQFNAWARAVSIFAAVDILFIVWLFRKNDYSITSLPSMMLIITVIFNYGQLFLMGLTPSYQFYKSWNKWQIYPEKTYELTALIVLISIVAFALGVLFINNKVSAVPREHAPAEENKKLLRKCGWIILALTLPFNMIESALLIRASIIYSYSETHVLGISNFITALGWISTLGVVLLMFGAENEKKRKRVYLIFLAYYAIIMVSGNRGNSVIAIACMTIFYFKGVRVRVRAKKVFGNIGFLILAFVLLVMLDTIREYRGFANKSIAAFSQSFAEHAQDNFILENIEEYGGTVAVISIITIYLSQQGSLLYGWTYLSGLFSAIPNVGNISNTIVNSGNLLQLVKYTGNIYGRYQSIGSNYIAEMYLNFGPFWWVGMIFVGALAAKLFHAFRVHGDSIKSAYLVMPIVALIEWTRWSYSSLVRLFVWGAALLWVVYRFCRRKEY